MCIQSWYKIFFLFFPIHMKNLWTNELQLVHKDKAAKEEET